MSRWRGRNLSRFHSVDSLSGIPQRGKRYWLESPRPDETYTHNLFRFPAKFHPPVVRWALSAYSKKNTVVLDPFMGSGTLQVEALIQGRTSIGIDIDPFSCFIAQVKSTPLNPDSLGKGLDNLQARLVHITRPQTEQERLIGSDIDKRQYEREAKDLWIPDIPNIEHWFRRHVIVDLARLLAAIRELRCRSAERNFYLACFAANIRRVSNADPVPVSGLEVTSMQAKKNAEREINVLEDFIRRSRTAVHGMRALWDAWKTKRPRPEAIVACGDAQEMESILATKVPSLIPFSLAITSPPYCAAVEYSRRHKWEMYWLNFVRDQTQHQAMTKRYIGNPHGQGRNRTELRRFELPPLNRLLRRVHELDEPRAISLERYFAAMEKTICEFGRVMKNQGIVIFVVGNSKCAGIRIPTASLVEQLGAGHFRTKLKFSYAIRNHYMQYGLRNGEGIREEWVLVLERR